MYAIQPVYDSTTNRQMALRGACGFDITDGRVVINIGEIANDRAPGDVSGTLSVELWALKQPYNGGDFEGVAVAGTMIGEVYGQHFLSDCRYDLLFDEPSAGAWNMTLMLREWDGNGFVTRDFVNFVVPYTVTQAPIIERGEADNVINLRFAGNERTAAADPVVAEKPAAPAKAPAQSRAPAKAATSKSVETKPAAKVESNQVSVNKASVKQLAAVKGISKKLAKNIVDARPYASMNDLLSVKGMDHKALERVGDVLCL